MNNKQKKYLIIGAATLISVIIIIIIVVAQVNAYSSSSQSGCKIAQTITVTSITDAEGNDKAPNFVGSFNLLNEDEIPSISLENIKYIWGKSDSDYYIVCHENDDDAKNTIKFHTLTQITFKSTSFDDSCVVSNPIEFTGEWTRDNVGDRIVEWQASY